MTRWRGVAIHLYQVRLREFSFFFWEELCYNLCCKFGTYAIICHVRENLTNLMVFLFKYGIMKLRTMSVNRTSALLSQNSSINTVDFCESSPIYKQQDFPTAFKPAHRNISLVFHVNPCHLDSVTNWIFWNHNKADVETRRSSVNSIKCLPCLQTLFLVFANTRKRASASRELSV